METYGSSAGSMIPFDPPAAPCGFVCPHWHLSQVRCKKTVASLEPESGSFLSSWVPSLVPLEKREGLRKLASRDPGGAGELCLSLVWLWRPKEKGGWNGLWGIAGAVTMSGWNCWLLFKFLFGETSVFFSCFEGWSCSSLYGQDFGEISMWNGTPLMEGHLVVFKS